MSRAALYTVVALLLSVCCLGQTAIVESQDPLYKAPLNGDKIRSLYDYVENTSSVNRNPGIENEITLAIFHSKNVYPFTVLNPKEQFKEGAYFIKTYGKGKKYTLTNGFLGTGIVPLFDSSAIVVTAYGITPQNKADFQFRVLFKRRVLLPWQPVRFFSPVYMYGHFSSEGREYKEMAYLGRFNAPIGSDIIIEVRSLRNPEQFSAASAFWARRSPEVIATFTSGEMKSFFELYKYQWKYDFQQPRSTYYGDIKTRPADSLLHLEKTFTSGNRDIFFYLKDKVRSEKLVEYNLVRDQKDSSGWMANSFDPNIIWLQQLKPGAYQLLLRYAFQRQSISTYLFTILPAWYQTFWFKMVMGLISLMAILSVYLLVRNRRQKARIKAQQTAQQITQAEIRSLKSQFNPHFVFNALNSIQGLITKNDIEQAHKYLNDFSTLLRTTLKESEREMTSLSKDIALMDHYLKLEQLRFGFSYRIQADAAINKDALEVPVLLLQPVIENAVKHGISGLYEKGHLVINYTIEQNDLLVTVKDNGTGNNLGSNPAGYGLKLTRERVALINKLLTAQSIDWSIHKEENGTTVIFVFKNWLL